MVELGLIDPATAPDAGNESERQWAEVEDPAWESAHMEVHAAMIEHLDRGVGRIIEKLKATGEYENTLIVFLADNGASPERMYEPGYDRPAFTRDGTPIEYTDDHYDRPGPETTMAGIGEAWAGAANTPFRFWKAWSHHGGIATPVIMHWPAGLGVAPGTLVREPAHVIDLMPTFLEAAGTAYPDDFAGRDIPPLEGRSLLPLVRGGTREPHELLFWQHAGGKAVRVGDWKLVRWGDQPLGALRPRDRPHRDNGLGRRPSGHRRGPRAPLAGKGGCGGLRRHGRSIHHGIRRRPAAARPGGSNKCKNDYY